MAVAEMRLLSLVGPKEQFDEVVGKCLVDRAFEPESTNAVLARIEGLRPFSLDNPYQSILRHIYSVLEKEKLEPRFEPYDDLNMELDKIDEYFKDSEENMLELEKEGDKLTQQITENRQILIQIEHLENVNANLEDIFNFEFVKLKFGRLPTEAYNAFIGHVEKQNDVFFFPTTIERDYVYGMYVTPNTTLEKADMLFSGLQFEFISVSGKLEGKPSEAAKRLREEIAEDSTRKKAGEEKIHDIKDREASKMLACYSFVRHASEVYDMRRSAACTEENFCVVGWVPKDDLETITREIAKFPSVSYALDTPENMNVDFKPPTKLKNNKLFKPFEMFIGMYGMPAYNEIDPTSLVALTYSLFFGIMFGDIGQGLLIVLIGYLLSKYKKMALGSIMMRIGVMSTIFGFFYGSFFGNEEIYHELTHMPVFNVLSSANNTNFTLVGAVVLGSLGIMTVMVVNIINGIRNHDFEKFLFSSNGVAGLLLYWSVLLIVLSLVGMNFIPASLKAVFYTIGIGLPLVLIFLKNPLGKIVKRKKDWKPKQIGEYIIENAIELFDVLLSFMTNTISFIRIGAFAISHAIMMMVVYTLASGVNGDNIVVLIIGNIFVVALEGLVVGIQCLRLQFYEMFSRFYEGSGRQFAPISIDYSSKLN